MQARHNFLHRQAVIVRAGAEPLTAADSARLAAHGLGESALGSEAHGDRAPDWLAKWAALVRWLGRGLGGAGCCRCWREGRGLRISGLVLGAAAHARRMGTRDSQVHDYDSTLNVPPFPASFPRRRQVCEYLEVEEACLKQELLHDPRGFYTDSSAAAGAPWGTWRGTMKRGGGFAPLKCRSGCSSAAQFFCTRRAHDWELLLQPTHARARLSAAPAPPALPRLPAEAKGVISSRLQNVVITLDKVKMVLAGVEGQSRDPPLRLLSDGEQVEHLWTGAPRGGAGERVLQGAGRWALREAAMLRLCVLCSCVSEVARALWRGVLTCSYSDIPVS